MLRSVTQGCPLHLSELSSGHGECRCGFYQCSTVQTSEIHHQVFVAAFQGVCHVGPSAKAAGKVERTLQGLVGKQLHRLERVLGIVFHKWP